MSFWHAVKWIALLVLALAFTLGMARLFSGGEDAWVRAADGTWVAHGHPAGPAPSPDYQPPAAQGLLPWLFLAALGGGLLAAAFFASRAPATRHSINRSLRFLGAASIIGGLLAGALGLALVIWFALESGPLWEGPSGTVLLVLLLCGLAAFLALLAAQAYGAKKVLEAHYDLKRTTALLQDTLERLNASRPAQESP